MSEPKELGQFAIPMGGKELLLQLWNGVPCEWPAHVGWMAVKFIKENTFAARFHIEQAGDRIYITPELITLNVQGRELLQS